MTLLTGVNLVILTFFTLKNGNKMNTHTSLENVKTMANQLSIADKIRLIEAILPEIRTELFKAEIVERAKLKGLWQSLEISDVEITKNRQTTWQNFPRENF